MKLLFVHQNYPAQFGTIARLVKEAYAWDSVYCTHWKGANPAQEFIKYPQPRVATGKVDFLARNFENCSLQAIAVHKAVKDAGLSGKIDAVVGHSGFGSTLLLRDLLGCPVINLFEFFYRPDQNDQPFRPEFPVSEAFRRRLALMNATILLDLNDAAAGYTPTHFQRNQFPAEYLPKIQTLFDGIDHRVFHRKPGVKRVVAGKAVPPGTKIVTYVSRGFEAMRGFDIFVKAAKIVYREYPDVLFVCVGSDRVCYGGDLRYIKEKSFREHVWKNEMPDDSKFHFVGTVNTRDLVDILSLGDAHMYFTVPFVLSWSLFNAMSCEARIVSCNTAPVREVIVHGESGLLADFHDADGHAANVLRILRDPAGSAALGASARQTVMDKYTIAHTVPAFAALVSRVLGRPVPRPANS